MGIIEKLLGKRAKNSVNLASEIDSQKAGIDTARDKIATAQIARKTAIEDFDADGHRAADEEIAEAGREIERRENAIERLNAAHAERVEVEKRETFRREDAALAEEGAAMTARIRVEYPEGAARIAKLVADLAAYQRKRNAMLARAKELRELATCRDAEDFRGVSAKRWSASWRSPDGTYTIDGTIESAPRGSIIWKDGVPVAANPGVTVEFRGGGTRQSSLVESVGDLPRLLIGETDIHVGYRPEKPTFVPLADRI